VAHTKKRARKTSSTEKWFAILFTALLAIQAIRDLVFAFGEQGTARVRGFVMAAFFGLVSYGVWRTFQSRNSN
jgi:hypothetical protein